MSTATMQLMEKVLALPMDERVILAQHVWDSVEHFIIDPEIEKSWMDEAERRWHEIEQGRVQCIPAKEVMKKARASLNK
ncbi:addiction module protein [bacterium]|nr:addiction module protein [bacterium]